MSILRNGTSIRSHSARNAAEAVARGEAEVRIIVQPKETRIAFSGDPRGLSVGDYVRVTVHKNVARVGAAEMKCTKVIWVLE